MIGTRRTALGILRGNSASGKTSVARALQQARPQGQLAVVSQDVVRREVLRVPDTAGNPAVELIDAMVRFALDREFSIVLEGIFNRRRYGDMLEALVRATAGRPAHTSGR